jgi:hypothetical protein
MKWQSGDRSRKETEFLFLTVIVHRENRDPKSKPIRRAAREKEVRGNGAREREEEDTDFGR